jgi:tRNA pseudouridine38-40 synthase
VESDSKSSGTRLKATIAYDGTAYAGWQVQPGHVTVQSEIERVVREVTGEKARVHCSGRTDAGVHAKGQVAHFDLNKTITPQKLQTGMNALLAEDIRIMSLRIARPDFHARYDAKSKLYLYFIWNTAVLPPFLTRYRTHIKRPLDIALMAKAAGHLEGEHDFAAFSANPNREVDGTVRILHELSVRQTASEVRIAARGNGFLYKMVRSLSGFLIRVGGGEIEPESAVDILKSCERTARVPTAPPQGLFLWKVQY